MAQGLGLMAKATSSTVLYLAGMAALTLLVTSVELKLTREGHSGFVGAIELPVLLAGAVLFIAGGVGAARSSAASWPLLAAICAVSLVAVLGFVTLSDPAVGSAVTFEFLAAVLGILLINTIQKR